MPFVYAHAFCGERMLPLCDADVLRALDAHKEQFLLGCMGPDPWFFHNPLPWINDRAERMAKEMAQVLNMAVRERSLAATEVLGPTPAFFTRLDGRYRWHIVIYTPDPHRLLEDIPIPRPWVVDIDPESTL